jgi:hypothetical protein
MEVGDIIVSDGNGDQLKVISIETDENGNQIINYEPCSE